MIRSVQRQTLWSGGRRGRCVRAPNGGTLGAAIASDGEDKAKRQLAIFQCDTHKRIALFMNDFFSSGFRLFYLHIFQRAQNAAVEGEQ